MPGLVLLPALGALIGWVTNVMAIRYLFRPHRAIRLPAGIVIQGLIPRYRGELAAAAARVISDRLLTSGDVLAALDVSGSSDRLVSAAADAMQAAGERLVPSLIPGVLRRMVGRVVRTVVESEGRELIAESAHDAFARMQSELDIGETVRRRVLEVPLDELETLVYSVVGRELRAVEAVGAVVGFIVGLSQALLLMALT